MSRRAVAIDLGASSARFAIGERVGDRIEFEIVEQIPHKPLSWNGHEVWDFDLLFGFCRRALDAAKQSGAESLAIDTWGVDHGFVDSHGRLLQPPICYRDKSHVAVFEEMSDHRRWLYRQTGIQHQPFNTLYQLIARKRENASLFEPGTKWLLLPDLLLFMLGAEAGYDRSIASTTQLTDAAGDWNGELFKRFGLPIPGMPITSTGLAGHAAGVALLRINGHDTASAVLGMGSLEGTAFASVGTWALVGKLAPFDASRESEADNWTNERQTDGTVRRLTNVPGFYVLNRLHEELEIDMPFGEWLEAANETKQTFDPYDERLFAPVSMVDAVNDCLGKAVSPKELAGIALESLAQAISDRILRLGVRRARIAGGGARSRRLCQAVAAKTGLTVHAGPHEATILGNLALQLAGCDTAAATKLANDSLEPESYSAHA